MPDYREQNQEAKTWRRANAVMIQNPLPGQGTPIISFHEHDAIRLGEHVVTTAPRDSGPGGLQIAFEPGKVIPLLDPVTGAEIGTTTHRDVYVQLFSVYMAAAGERDARVLQHAADMAAAAAAAAQAAADAAAATQTQPQG